MRFDIPVSLVTTVVISLLVFAGCGAESAEGGDTDASETTDAPTDGDAAPTDVDASDVPMDVSPDAVLDTDMADGGGDTNPDMAGDTVDTMMDMVPTCAEPLGAPCNPIPIDSLPFVDSRDTTTPAATAWDRYGCAPTVNEGGGEFVYRLELTQTSSVNVSVDDLPGDGIDVDVHILSSPNTVDCVSRANVSTGRILDPGTWWIVVDTWVDGEGSVLAGPYTLTVTAVALGTGSCAMETRDLRMFWTACDPGVDCYEQGGEYFLRTPAIGPVVKEAHLVTTADGFGNSWPTSFTDGIAAHYTMSEGVSGYSMTRTEPWAPAGEGGSEYGQGSTGAKIPADAEAWYVNMYWRDRPAPGTRFIIMNPSTGQAVVAAGGYETGPGSNTAIGGVVEEVHHYLGTGHRDDLTIGFALDQTLPYGPIVCP